MYIADVIINTFEVDMAMMFEEQDPSKAEPASAVEPTASAATQEINGKEKQQQYKKYRSRRWGLTTWKEEAPVFNEDRMVYMMAVKHKAPETGKEHWYSFIIFHQSITMTAIKKLIGDNQAHCIALSNDGTEYLQDGHDTITGPIEFGNKPRFLGKKKKAEDNFFENVLAGTSQRELFKMAPRQYLRYRKDLSIIRGLFKDTTSKYSRDSYNFKIEDWTCHWHLYGDADCGKTQFAKAQFDHPLYVRHADHFSLFDPCSHDGIVVDELHFNHWPAISVINMLNRKDDAAIHVRYLVADIPAGVRMIFCSNSKDIFYDKERTAMVDIESILAKIKQVHISSPIWLMRSLPSSDDCGFISPGDLAAHRFYDV